MNLSVWADPECSVPLEALPNGLLPIYRSVDGFTVRVEVFVRNDGDEMYRLTPCPLDIIGFQMLEPAEAVIIVPGESQAIRMIVPNDQIAIRRLYELFPTVIMAAPIDNLAWYEEAIK